jgi:ribonuclease HI
MASTCLEVPDAWREHERDAVLYIHGTCSGNPGPGRWTFVLVGDSGAVKCSGATSWTTNNRMEITATLNGLRVTRLGSVVKMITDSHRLYSARVAEPMRR